MQSHICFQITASQLDDTHRLLRNVGVDGIIYVATDVRYDIPGGDIAAWAIGPLDEITFLRGILEGRYDEWSSETLVSIVSGAPMHQTPSILEENLVLAERRAGQLT